MTDLLQQLGPVRQYPGGLVVLHIRMARGAELANHRHNQATVVCVLAGSLEVIEDGIATIETAGTIRLSRSSTTRIVRANDGADCCIISCRASHPVARHLIWKRTHTSQSTRVSQPAWTSATQEALAASDVDLETHCMSLLNGLLATIDRRMSSPPSWLNDALTALAASRGEKGACRSIAQSLDIHPVHMGRVVRRYTGLTVREMLRRQRIMHASRELRRTERAVSAIAHDAGFSDHSHLTREFIRRYGDVPSRHRLRASDVVSIQSGEFPDVHLGDLGRIKDTSEEHGEVANAGRRRELGGDGSGDTARDHAPRNR
jgi:AraC family transcriptional regulator